MTTRLVCDEPSFEKSTRLLEMSGGEKLRRNRWRQCDSVKCGQVVTTRLVCDEPSFQKSTSLLEMSGGERLRKIAYVEFTGSHATTYNVGG